MFSWCPSLVAPSDVAAIVPLVTVRTQTCLFIKMTVTNLFNKLHGAETFEKLTIFHLISIFCAMYDTWRFITVFNRAYHLYITWARWIQSMPCCPISVTSNLIPSSHLCQDFRSGLLSGFLSNPCMYYSSPNTSHMFPFVWSPLTWSP